MDVVPSSSAASEFNEDVMTDPFIVVVAFELPIVIPVVVDPVPNNMLLPFTKSNLLL